MCGFDPGHTLDPPCFIDSEANHRVRTASPTAENDRRTVICPRPAVFQHCVEIEHRQRFAAKLRQAEKMRPAPGHRVKR